MKSFFVMALIAGVFPAHQELVQKEQPSKRTAQQRIVGYYAEWSIYARKYHVSQIPASSLTHINYAFAIISTSGECVPFDRYAAVDKFYKGDKWDKGYLRGNYHQLQILKKKHRHLRTLIAIGGWNHSSRFSDVARTKASRHKFAQSCVAFIKKYGFDGVDLDWEYPVGGGKSGNKTSPQDKRNYTLLLEQIRSCFDAQGKKDRRHYLLTIAGPAGPTIYKNLELAQLHKHLDWINIMSYDFHGSWSTRTNFNAPLFASTTNPAKASHKHLNIHAAIQAYRAAGIPADKIVVGLPFYGRGWSGVKNSNNGLFQPFTQVPKGTWDRGVFDWKDLKKNYLPKYQRHWDDEAKVPWLFHPKTGVMISYDDPKSLRIKADYVRRSELGGVMIWELSADDSDHSLLQAIQKGLGVKRLTK